MHFELNPRRIYRRLLTLIFVLLCANVAGIISRQYLGHGHLYGLIPLFDFNAEMNIPTLYSSFALIVVAILLALIAASHKELGSQYGHWAGLAGIFLFLSIDEFATLHEQFVGPPLREFFGTTGLLYYAWVIPYGICLVFIGIVYLRFLLRLPREIMILFLISGATFVLGAIGVESLGGREDDLHGFRGNITYRALYTLEETLEMLGIATFIYTLLAYIKIELPSLKISIHGGDGG